MDFRRKSIDISVSARRSERTARRSGRVVEEDNEDAGIGSLDGDAGVPTVSVF